MIECRSWKHDVIIGIDITKHIFCNYSIQSVSWNYVSIIILKKKIKEVQSFFLIMNLL